MLISIITVTSILVLLLLIGLSLMLIKILKLDNIQTNINEEKIMKNFLLQSKIENKYYKQFKDNVNIIDILDNFNYYNNSQYINILKNINESEKKIDLIYNDLQSSSSRWKLKISLSKKNIKSEQEKIEQNYILIINKIFKDNNTMTIKLIENIRSKIIKIKTEIQRTIAEEEKNEIETWKSEIDRLNNYIYLDETFKNLILQIKSK